MDPQQTLQDIYEALFHIRGPYAIDYDEIVERIEALANWIANTDDDYYDWPDIETCLHSGDVIIGAYWHLTQWHEGQSSDTYRALCVCGSVFSPGMTGEPEDNSPEGDVYRYLNELAETESKVTK